MPYKKILITIGSAFLVAILATTNFANAVDLNQATTTLPQNEEWSIMAYAALGQNVGQDFLAAPLNSSTATDYEKRILAITAQGSDPTTISSENFVAKLESMFDGNQLGDPGLLNDDIFGILALKSAGISDNVVSASRQFILNNENSDGGWGYAPGIGSDSNSTAMAVAALAITGSVPSGAFSYLQRSQDSSGGYAYSPGLTADGASTAWVISGLISAGQAVPADAQNFLENLQLPDGSFKWQSTDTSGSSLVTAYAVIALSGHGLPIRIVSSSPTPAPARSPEPAPSPATAPTPTPTPQSTPTQIPTPTPASSSNPTQPTDGNCLIPVFITDFAFPPEGGKIVRINGQMYFVKNYEPGCANAGSSGTPVVSSTPFTSLTPSPTPAPASTQSSDSNCLIPVFITDFAFPPEGGEIVRINGQMYFVKNYEPSCANAGANGTAVSTTPSPSPAPTPVPSPTPTPTPAPTQTATEPSVQLKISYSSNIIFQDPVNFSGSPTVLSILNQAASNNQFTVTTKQTGLGTLVSGIDGFMNSGASGWQYAVNGSVPNVGADSYTIKNGDSIQWFYGAPNSNPY